MTAALTPGPLALIGGGEHRDPCRDIDRWLLDRIGRQRPEVVILPAASPRGSMARTAAQGRNHWARLGARVSVVRPASEDATALALVDASDLVVLTGGLPGLVAGRLGASRLWDRIVDRWLAGGALSGSSAGAMALFEWRLSLRAPHPLKLVPGLGPLRGHVAVPHFDRLVTPHALVRRVTGVVQQRWERLAVLGIDEHTAVVSFLGESRVLGCGGITLVSGSAWRRYPAGAAVDVELSDMRSATAALDVPLPAPALQRQLATPVASAVGAPARAG